MISNANWNLGGSSTYNDVTASMFYEKERGTETYQNSRPTTWTGQIALMYPSDYGYATSGGSITDRASCLAKELYNWDSSSYSDCKNNDWLYKSRTTQWTLTPYSSYSRYAFYVSTLGRVHRVNAATSNYSVSPALYLSSNVKISGGDGSENSPFELSVE